MRIALAAFSATALITTVVSAADISDADHLVDVMNRRLESQGMGGEVAWMNPSTGNGGIVTILSTDESDPQLPCRSYRYTIEDPSALTVVVEGNACRVVPGVWQRSEAQVSLTLDPDSVSTPPVARADPEPAEPPPPHLPPAHKPDPDAFYASIPTPSVY